MSLYEGDCARPALSSTIALEPETRSIRSPDTQRSRGDGGKMSVEMMKLKLVVLLSAVNFLTVAGSSTVADSQWIFQPLAKGHELFGSGQHTAGRAEPHGRAFSSRGLGGGASGGGASGGGRSGFSDDSRSSKPRHSDPIPGPAEPDRLDAANTGTPSGRANGDRTGRTDPAGRSGRGSRADGIAGGSSGIGSKGAGRGDPASRW
jgi:hypothetical protein